MKAAVKTAWVKDLRDNPDAQGRGLLDYLDSEGNRKNCCLGRLCRLAVAAGVIPEPELHGREYRYLDEAPGGESFNQACSLPRKVADWVGLPEGEDDVIIIPSDGAHAGVYAIEANDAMGMTFAEIADEADKNVPVTG
jgi:hypothetical protein